MTLINKCYEIYNETYTILYNATKLHTHQPFSKLMMYMRKQDQFNKVCGFKNHAYRMENNCNV